MSTAPPVAELEKDLAAVSLDKEAKENGAAPTNGTSPLSFSDFLAQGAEAKESWKLPIAELHDVQLPPPRQLTEDQQSRYKELLEQVRSWKEVPSAKGNEGPLTDLEKMWLSRESLLRYLRATKWTVAEASKRLLGTLTWRRDFGVEGLSEEVMSRENDTGKQLLLGYDVSGRPCHYLNVGRQNTLPGPHQVQHLVFMVERVLDLTVAEQETLCLIVDFKPSKERKNTNVGINVGREVLNILQTHYPERLGRALVMNMPWVVLGFFKLITPFIDPMTKEKLKFNEDMRAHVPAQILWNEIGGDLDFVYEHETYWPALLKLCEEKRKASYERWVKGGKLIGESENYIKGGKAPSISQAAVSEGESVSEKTKEDIPVESKVEASAVAA